MAAALFLGFFIILGLGVVLVAMRGGPRGVRDTLEVGRRRPLRASEFGLAALVALVGIVVPILVMTNGDASAGPSGTKLTKTEEQGRVLFSQKCATCHTLADANAVGKVGPDLDVLQPPLALTLNAIKLGRAGQGQMPAELLEAGDARKVATYLADVAGR
ncbi:MAG TPA: c-type cytochrome [Solirubrobacteraceae bacterium]|jgi:mono/diheme cytochrome c family protein